MKKTKFWNLYPKRSPKCLSKIDNQTFLSLEIKPTTPFLTILAYFVKKIDKS